MTITKRAAEGLATVVNEVRTDWDTAGIIEAIRKVRERPLADVAVAAVLAATVPTNRTPAIIALAGDHWRDVRTATTSEADRHPSTTPNHDRCAHCGRAADHCHSTTVQANDPHEFRSIREAAIQRARQERRQADRPDWDPTAALNPGRRIPTHLRQQMTTAIRQAQQGRAGTGPVGNDNAPADPTDPDTHHEAQNGAQEAEA